MWTASRKLRVGALGALALALFLQWFSMSSNASSQATLRRLYKGGASPTALVLTAHPDDEVMFFGPTILNLVASGWNLRAICISDGE
jgi:N-acetylglucosaminylphosphatidylinositol deacetylase